MKKPNSELYLPVFLRVWRKCRDSLPHIADSICTFHFLSLLCSFQENKQWGMMRKFKIVIRMFLLAWVNRESIKDSISYLICRFLIFGFRFSLESKEKPVIISTSRSTRYSNKKCAKTRHWPLVKLSSVIASTSRRSVGWERLCTDLEAEAAAWGWRSFHSSHHCELPTGFPIRFFDI